MNARKGGRREEPLQRSYVDIVWGGGIKENGIHQINPGAQRMSCRNQKRG